MTDAALKQHPEGYRRRETPHVSAADLFGVGLIPCVPVCCIQEQLCSATGHELCWAEPGSRHWSAASFQPLFLFINSEMTDRGWSLI